MNSYRVTFFKQIHNPTGHSLSVPNRLSISWPPIPRRQSILPVSS